MATGLFNLKQVNQAISQGAWSGYIAPRWVEYLTVAGGGGASTTSTSGGGGGGGLLTGIVTVSAGASYTVTVGAGGATASTTGNTGANSVFGSISALGGGGGSQSNTGATAGGSGGGAGGGTGAIGGAGTSGQGNAGGNAGSISGASPFPSCGGGGAGTVGLAPKGSVAGDGGAGIASAITGTVVTYAGGGGGGIYNTGTPGNGGVGGGGTGGVTTGSAGGGNTGGGGGGAGFGAGAAGGSGIVVVRYPGNVQFYTGGTVTYSNGYIVHNFTANGTLAPTTPTVVSEYQISRSLRFNSADSTYLSRTATANGSRTTATASLWVKRSVMGVEHRLIAFDSTGSGTIFWLFFNTSDQLQIYTSGTAVGITSTQVFRDPSAWYHIVVGLDTNQATSSDRIKVYVNGSQITAFTGTQTYYTQGASIQFNNTAYTGFIGFNNSATLSGYMTEVNWIDGQQLTPTSFGYVNPTTGIWTPAKFVGGYGTNGAYLNFSDNSNTTAATLGKDNSGNGNNWTPNNFSVTAGAGNDSYVDSPTTYGTDTGVGGEVRGNYCTLNPISAIASVYNANYPGINNGGMAFTPGVTNWTTVNATMGVSSGKWYWEVSGTTANEQLHGVAKLPVATTANVTPYLSLIPDSYGYYSANGNKTSYSAVSASYGSSYTTNDVVGVALDMDAGTITFYKNNVSQGVAFTGLSGTFAPAFSANGNSSGITVNCNFGQRPFAYTAPSGFKALCTQNLPTPTIGATASTLAGKYFNTILWTGDGAATRSFTGIGFQPSFIWAKTRNRNDLYHALFDVVRGGNKTLFSNATLAEVTNSTNGYISSFNSDGFTVVGGADTNGSTNTYVGWNWAASGTGTTNTAGSITSTVSANTTSGFSVVTFTATADSGSIGHGLGVAPSMIIIKSRNNTSNWVVYHVSIGAGKYLNLNNTDAAVSNANTWQNTTPTSTVFYSNGPFVTGYTEVAYCFAEVAGYSKFGSYTGNGSADGTFVFTGFRPAFILVKASSGGSAASANWLMLDDTRNTSNVVNNKLAANLELGENIGSIGDSTQNNYDFLSNGFKARTTNGSSNENGTTYIYMAFAENPFKYSLAR
jgi:hypothetical protein